MRTAFTPPLSVRINNLARDVAWKLMRAERLLDGPRPTLLDLARRLHRRYGHLTVVQAGANDGRTHDPLTLLRDRFELRGIVIEPLPDLHAILVETYRNQPGVLAIQAAIHAQDSDVVMYRVRPNAVTADFQRGIASLNPEHFKKSDTPAEAIESVRVPGMSIMAAIAQAALDRIDFLVLDCEGYDLEILKSLDLAAVKPTVIQFEHGLRDNLHDANDLWNAVSHLHSFGYEVVVQSEYDVLAFRMSEFQ